MGILKEGAQMLGGVAVPGSLAQKLFMAQPSLLSMLLAKHGGGPAPDATAGGADSTAGQAQQQSGLLQLLGGLGG